MNGNSPLHVLVVDDDEDQRANLRDILALDEHHVETAGTVAEVRARKDWSDLAAVILDRKLPDGSAEQLLPWLRREAPDASVLIVTGYSDLQGAIAALRLGASDYLIKPINPDALRASLLRIADRRKLSREKAHSEAAFRTLVEAALCMTVILRPDHTLAYFSPFAEELTGYSAPEVVGIDYLTTFIPEEARAAVSESIHQALGGTAVRGVKTPVLCRDGSRRWVLWNARRLPDYEGAPAVLSVGQDITALEQAQERTLQAERLAAIGQMVTGLAHESGNALARSQACLEMLVLEVQDRPEALQLLERVQRAQDHLQHLYEEVRNYAAPLVLERENWPLEAVWQQAWANLSVSRQGRAAELVAVPSSINLRCFIDPFRLEQVFRNILETSLAACKDPVRITVSCGPAWLDRAAAVEVVVRDNGPGLSVEQRKRIFEPFFTTKTKGTGLGMAIAKRIIEAHGGKITVGPVGSSGAEIHLTLPREVS